MNDDVGFGSGFGLGLFESGWVQLASMYILLTLVQDSVSTLLWTFNSCYPCRLDD
jgi:hypothetical protein